MSRGATATRLDEGNGGFAVTASLNGDPHAFERVFTELAAPLRNYLTSLTGDRGRSEDLLQETFLQIHRSRYAYLPGRPVKPWAFGIARNVYRMHRRSARRMARYEAPPEEELPEAPVRPTSESFPEREDLTRALLRVDASHREALLLHHLWGFSFREVGEMLGITEGAAKLRSFRGIRSLRVRLGVDHPTVSPTHEGAGGQDPADASSSGSTVASSKRTTASASGAEREVAT